MTNAEKLARDTKKMAKVMVDSTGLCVDVDDCRFCKFIGLCHDIGKMKEWLEAEAEEEENNDKRGKEEISNKSRFDRATEKWFKEHPGAETTVVQCEVCGLVYKPCLGHKCKGEKRK